MLPEQGQCPQSPLSGSTADRRHGAAADGRVWRLGNLTPSAGSGSCPAPAVTVSGIASAYRRTAVTAATRAGDQHTDWPFRLIPPRLTG